MARVSIYHVYALLDYLLSFFFNPSLLCLGESSCERFRCNSQKNRFPYLFGYFSTQQKNESKRFFYTSVEKSDFSNLVQKKVTFPHRSKKLSTPFWVFSSFSCAESSPSIRKGYSCSISLWKSKVHVQKIIPSPR